MSIQMSLVFGVLVVQMVVLFVLLLPLPLMLRQNLVKAATALRQNTNFKVGLYFSSVLMLLQFVDCVKKLQRFSNVENPYFAQSINSARRSEMLYDRLALKFYAQRNLYITGAVLYLALSINTVVSILRNLVNKETQLRQKKLQPSGEKEKQAMLREKINQRDLDITVMKKQLERSQAAYDSLTAQKERSKDD